MPKGDFTKTKEFIIPLRGVVRDSQLAALLDQSGQEIGMPVTAVESVTGGVEISAATADAGYAAASAAQMLKSAAAVRMAWDDSASTEFLEPWSNLSAWVTTGTPGVQVNGGRLYSTGSAGGGSGAVRGVSLQSGEVMRAVFDYNHITGGGSGGVMIGVSSGTAGAAPATGGGDAFGLYFRWGNLVPQQISSGATTDLTGQPNLRTTGYVVTVVVDLQYISVIARSKDGADEIRCRRARSGFACNNLFVFNSDTRALSGISIGPVGMRKSLATTTSVTDDAGFTAHWSGDGTQDYKLTLPAGYDSRRPVPLAILFHGNGSDENHFSSNSNGKAIANALLSAGFAVLSCTYTANKSTWGSSASLDAYVAAYRYFRDRYALGAVCIYGNSMGALESLLAVADGRIPAIVAWAATHPATSLAAAYAGAFTAVIKTAYGIATDGADYPTKTAGHDPMLLPVNAFRRVPMLALYATDDTDVPPASHAVPFFARLVGSNAVVTETTTGGHSASVADFAPAVVAHFKSALGEI